MGLHLIKAFPEDFTVNLQGRRKRFDQRVSIETFPGFSVFAGQNNAVNRTGINQRLSIAIEYDSAGRRNRQQPDALVLGNLGIARAVNDLKDVKTNREGAEHHQYQSLNYAQPQPEILRIVNEFHE